MITTKQINEFIASNFRIAVLSARLVKDKIELSLYVKKDKDDCVIKTINMEEIKEIKKNPKQLIEYLINAYLHNNIIVRTEYFTSINHHKDKTCFIINGTNSTLQIALDDSLLDLLPNNFMEKMEENKRQGIIKVLKDVNLKNFSLENVNEKLSSAYKTGLRYYKENTKYPVAYYDALKIEDVHGKVIIPDHEINFIKELLKIITEKEKINLDELKSKYERLSTWFTTFIKYELNSKTTLTTYTTEGLKIYKSFLEEYIKTYEDNVTNNQLKLNVKKLKLERKGE